MTLTQLKNRQQTLLNLIANVGGKNNIRKWVDELMNVEVQIDLIETSVKELDSCIRQSWDALVYANRKQLVTFTKYLTKHYPAPMSKTEASLRIYIEDFIAFAGVKIKAIETQSA